MGMFNEIKCLYPLPEGFEWAQTKTFQTKSIEPNFMELYEIRADGTLWKENYEIEDHSDPTAEGLQRIIGCMTRVNQRFEPVDNFIGEIRFYDCLGEECEGWIEFSAYFVHSKLDKIYVIRYDAVK